MVPCMKTGPVAVLALGVAALLAGCSGDPESTPTALPPLLPSASPSPSAPSASPVPLPSEATAATPQGAAAFTRHYFAVLNEAYRTPDTAALRQLSDPGCNSCSNFIREVDDLRQKGHHYEGGSFVLRSVEAPPVEGGDVVLDVVYANGETRELDAAGQQVSSFPPRSVTPGQVRLLRRDARWTVRGFRPVSK